MTRAQCQPSRQYHMLTQYTQVNSLATIPNLSSFVVVGAQLVAIRLSLPPYTTMETWQGACSVQGLLGSLERMIRIGTFACNLLFTIIYQQ